MKDLKRILRHSCNPGINIMWIFQRKWVEITSFSLMLTILFVLSWSAVGFVAYMHKQRKLDERSLEKVDFVMVFYWWFFLCSSIWEKGSNIRLSLQGFVSWWMWVCWYSKNMSITSKNIRSSLKDFASWWMWACRYLPSKNVSCLNLQDCLPFVSRVYFTWTFFGHGYFLIKCKGFIWDWSLTFSLLSWNIYYMA